MRPARQGRMVQPLRQPINDRCFKRVVMQDRRIDERSKLRLAPDRFFGLAADARPYWINCVDCRLRLILRHRHCLPGKPQQRHRLLPQDWCSKRHKTKAL